MLSSSFKFWKFILEELIIHNKSNLFQAPRQIEISQENIAIESVTLMTYSSKIKIKILAHLFLAKDVYYTSLEDTQVTSSVF